MNMHTKDQKTGLFLVSYNVSTGLAGAPNLLLNLTVDTTNEHVNGVGHVTQAISPPLNVASNISGTFTYMTVMPNETHVMVKGEGYPQIHWPPHGGTGPVIPENLQFYMVLSNDWNAGTANFKYRTSLAGPMVSIENAKVTLASG